MNWKMRIAVHITAHLNDPNLKSQGKNKPITALYVECFFLKLKLWKSQVSSENLVHFSTCKTADTNMYVILLKVFAKYDIHLKSLSKEFEKGFGDFAFYECHFVLFLG